NETLTVIVSLVWVFYNLVILGGAVAVSVESKQVRRAHRVEIAGVTPDIIMPTGNEETETGEKFEDNALPWDSIDAAKYVKSDDL
ncbi:carboxy terminal-processing peptidase, partial [Salmonella enterica subsp. enterica serovar Kentucky]|nr:carboxy terminal-processing peptidase [Salmonella enterica subsp. enterica serovar Kentucky]